MDSETDYLKELHYLGITARLKRLSDSMTYSIRALYKSRNLDIEPSWHLVFLILQEKGSFTMTEIALSFNYSQAAITKMLAKMAKAGYLDFVPNEKDNRKKQVILSEKAKQALPEFEKVWDAGKKVIAEMLQENAAFSEALTNFENQNRQGSFKDRVAKKLDS